VNPITRILLGSVAVGACLIAGSAQAVTVIPNVSNTTAVATTSGQVPDPDPLNFLGALFTTALPVVENNTSASVADTVSSLATGGAETSDGAANATIDSTDFFGGSVYRARSEVFTDPAIPPTNGPSGDFGFEFNMNNQSLVAIVATLDTIGLVGPGDTATVDAVFNLSGSLVYEDPTGAAGATEVQDPFDPSLVEIVPDMQTSVSVQFLLADVVVPPLVPDPENPPVTAVFSAGATLESVLNGGTPMLSTQGDLNVGDFIMNGVCDGFTCQYDIDISVPFFDLQSLGFGDTFEAGLILLTSVEGVSGNFGGAGRRLESNFFDTASFSVTLEVEQAGAVPEPGSVFMLGIGLVVLTLTRRRSRGTYPFRR